MKTVSRELHRIRITTWSQQIDANIDIGFMSSTFRIPVDQYPFC